MGRREELDGMKKSLQKFNDRFSQMIKILDPHMTGKPRESFLKDISGFYIKDKDKNEPKLSQLSRKGSAEISAGSKRKASTASLEDEF